MEHTSHLNFSIYILSRISLFLNYETENPDFIAFYSSLCMPAGKGNPILYLYAACNGEMQCGYPECISFYPPRSPLREYSPSDHS
jgi:hypothetical protein